MKLENEDCWDLLGFLLFCVVYCYLANCPEKNDFWVGEIIFLKLESGDCWDLLGFSSFTASTAAWRAARKKKGFWVGKIIFLKLETSDCWDLMGFLLLRCLLSKRLVVLAYIGGLSFFFFLIVLGGWGNVVAWSFYTLMTPLFSQPHMIW